MSNTRDIQSIKETIERLNKENEQYQKERDNIGQDVLTTAKTGNSLIGKIGLGFMQAMTHADDFTKLSEKIEINKKAILDISTNLVLDFLKEHEIVDINSLHDNGFEFLPKDYIQYILDEQAKKGTLEVINLQNTTLYKSRLP